MAVHRLWRVVAIAVLMLSTTACATTTSENSRFTGHWTSTQWGDHYIRVEGSTVKIIYSHDDGRVTGTLRDSTVTGWWTEVPSRQPSADAGEVSFTLHESNGVRTIDGTWRYGVDGNPRENWDLTWAGDDIPVDIAAKFADPAAFLEHP